MARPVHRFPAGFVVRMKKLSHHTPQLRMFLTDPADGVEYLHCLVMLVLPLLDAPLPHGERPGVDHVRGPRHALQPQLPPLL